LLYSTLYAAKGYKNINLELIDEMIDDYLNEMNVA